MKNLFYMAFGIISGLLSLQSQEAADQGTIVMGRISNSLGRPVVKATLYVDSVMADSRSDKQGNYRITLPKESATLSVYSPKYGLLTLYYDGRRRADFRYPADTSPLSKGELAALGFTANKKPDPKKGPDSYKNYNTIYEMIQERFSGVVVSGSKILIRGRSSLIEGGNSDPLMIVDGNYVSDISFVNPSEVRSIEILKGEDATMYGSRGGNGVIIISLLR